MQKAEPYVIPQDKVWPPFNFTADEQSELTGIQTDINTYVDEMRDKFIAGNESFDNWDQYVANLQKMGSERYLAIYQSAADRYTK